MNKFFMMMVLVAVMVSGSGCMTHYSNFRTGVYSSGRTPDGGYESYSKTESYSYDSGYREYYRYEANSIPTYYGPTEVKTIHWGSGSGHNDQQDQHRSSGHRHNSGNNGSVVYVTPAPSAGQLRGLLPH